MNPSVSLSSINRIDTTPYGLGGLDLPIVRSNAAVGCFFQVLHGLKFCPRKVLNATQLGCGA